MMDWLFSLIPWWVYLLVAAVAVATVWRLLGWQGALAAAAGLVAVLGYGKGRADSHRDERAREDRRNTQAMKDRKEVDDEMDQLGSNDIDREWDRWLRDHDRSG